MIQSRPGRRRSSPPSPPVRILNNPDGSLCLISGKTKFTVSETPVTVDVQPEPTSPRCLTRAQTKLKMETVSPPGSPDRSSVWPLRARQTADKPPAKPLQLSPSKPLVRNVFICFFCKIEFNSRTDLIKHQNKCGAVPSALRKQENSTHEDSDSKPATRRRNSDIGKAQVKPMVADGLKARLVGERKRTRSEAEEEKPKSPRTERFGRSPPRAPNDSVKPRSPERLRPGKSTERRISPNRRVSAVQPVKPLQPVKAVQPVKALQAVKAEPITPPRTSVTRSKSPIASRPSSLRCQPESEKTRKPVRRSLLDRPNVSIERFTQSLFLVPKTKVKDIEQEKHHEIIEIDLTDESDVMAPKSPRTPATPRTLKSLLSFDSSMTQSSRTTADDEESRSSDSEGEGKTHSHSHHHGYHLPHNKTLLAIALTSNLGQKLTHLMEGAVERTHAIKDYELFCRTPIKSSFQDRLRYRDNQFPVTFRKTKHHRKFYHVYKFTKKQKVEFMKTVTTGLNKRSRVLYRSLPRCTVRMKRLTNRDVKRLSKVKPKFPVRMPMYGDQWRGPNILRRVPTKLTQNQLSANSALAAALLRSPTRVEIPYMNRFGGPPRPVGMFINLQQAQLQQQSLLQQQRQAGAFPSWNQPKNPNRIVAQVSPFKAQPQPSPPKQQARVPPLLRQTKTAGKKMLEERIDDDISIVVPAQDCINLSSDSDDSPGRDKAKRALFNPSMPAPKAPRLVLPQANKSYSAPLTDLPSPAKRVIAAAADESPDARTFLFRCHLCGMEERHKISQTKDIYKHLHSNHRGEVIHIVDYKLHGEVHLVEAMSKPPTVMRTAPEVAKCSDDKAAEAQDKRASRNAQKLKAAEIICLDD